MSDNYQNEAYENFVDSLTITGRQKRALRNLEPYEFLVDVAGERYGKENCNLSLSPFGFHFEIQAGVLKISLHYDAATDRDWALVLNTETEEEDLLPNINSILEF